MQTPHLSPAAHISPDEVDPNASNGHVRRMCLVLVRHGQTTFNVEKRLPGQLPGISLTEEGERQAVRAAVALSGLPLTKIISSPLARAHDTATLIGRGWGLDVSTDDRLMDTDVGHWAGQKIEDVAKSDPAWKAFVEHGSQPPPGVESMAHVQQRAVEVVEELRGGVEGDEYVVLVAHADVVKLIIAHYTGVAVDCAHFLSIDNASLSALAFEGEQSPALLALNWTASPGWLFARTRMEPVATLATETHDAQAQQRDGATPTRPSHEPAG